MRRHTAVAGLIPVATMSRLSRDALSQGQLRQITVLGSRPAYISVAASGSSTPGRIIEHSEPDHHLNTSADATVDPTAPTRPGRPKGPSIPSVLTSTDRAVKAAPPGGLRPALTALSHPTRPNSPIYRTSEAT